MEPDSVVNERGAPLYVAGVGASAGGLEPIEAFFGAVPDDCGVAFVVVQHLSPDYESRMDTLIRRYTKLEVVHVAHGMQVEPNHVYLVPARNEVSIHQGKLSLRKREPSEGFSLPIDEFFRSLAADFGPRAIGIVLSGSGSDGSRGVRAIHDAGGLVLCQDLASAKFDSMPKSAMETGSVDVELAPALMPHALMKFVHGQMTSDQLAEAEFAAPEPEATQTIVRLLKRRHGIDFSEYKSSTVRRRIERRIALGPAHDPDSYIQRLESDPSELDLLYKDLLIGVTCFFRDAASFEALDREVLRTLVHEGREDEVRVWIAGCASGEEAYTVAMLLLERARQLDHPPAIRVFATDVHRGALEQANFGRYSDEAVRDVPEALRQRYLSFLGEGVWQVRKELRSAVVFARQDLLQDAPFTRVDLVCCRNLLIYFQPQGQRHALSLMHFALRPNGFLMLGSSETPGELENELEPVDRLARIYRKRRDVRLVTDPRMARAPQLISTHEQRGVRWSPAGTERNLLPLYDAVLATELPPSFLIDESYTLLHSFGGAEQLLRFPSGRASGKLLDVIPDQLRTPLSGALQQAERTGVRVEAVAFGAEGDAQKETFRMTATAIQGRDGTRAFLVTLSSNRPTEQVRTIELDVSSVSRDYVRAIEDELRFTRESLQATVEELQASNEELQAANEELVAANEELQSTNEELQSVNEELHSLNAEHQSHILELTQLTDDMNNLLQSTQVGVAFLDGELRVRRFAGGVARLFRLDRRDEGRPFEDLVRNGQWRSLVSAIRTTLENGSEHEIEVDEDGTHCLLRILPYRAGTEVAGVVLTLIDISSLRRSEAAVRRLSDLVSSSTDAVIDFDLQGNIVNWNKSAKDLYGYDERGVVGSPLTVLAPPERREELSSTVRRVLAGERIGPLETQRVGTSGRMRWVSEVFFPIEDSALRRVGGAVSARDIEGLKRAEADVREAVRQRERFIAILSHELRNPMMALTTAAHELGEDHHNGARERAAEVIKRQVRHVGRLLDDLLDVTRLLHDRIELEREIIDLREIVPQVLDGIVPQEGANEVDLRVQLGDEALWVDADDARMQQLITNLLNNAMRFTPARRRITLSMAKRGAWIEVAVADEGVGISRDRLESIFEPFVKGGIPPVRPDGRSMGLGLAIVRAIVSSHNGRVQAQSPGPGQGTMITVELPAAERPDAAQGPEHPTGVHAVQGLPALKVLLLEDEEDNREMLAMCLDRAGYRVVQAGCGRDALAALERESFDAAIMDIGLPDMSGVEVGRRARQQYPTLRLVAVTGFGTQSDREQLHTAGFDAHLVKPVEVSKLRAALETLVGERTAHEVVAVECS
jgi:two-component system CheB/CheR fusion protein